MPATISFESGNKYEGDIAAARVQLSKGGKVITDAAQGSGADLLTLTNGGTKLLEVLIRKSNLYMLGFRNPGTTTWSVFTETTEEGTFMNKNVGAPVTTYGNKGKSQSTAYVPTSRKSVGVGCNYNDLGAFDHGTEVWDIVGALSSLAKFAPGTGAEFDTGAAVVAIIVVSEALRFENVCNAVKATIDGETALDLDSLKGTVTNWMAALANDNNVKIRAS